MMNKTLLASTIALALGTAGASMSASAVLVNNDTLNYTAATGGASKPAAGTGSWFSMKVSANTTAYTGISSLNGLTLGTTQAASGSHSGAPGCSSAFSSCGAPFGAGESPNIDNPWNFFGNTGMDQTTSPSNVLSASGNTGSVDMSGWDVTWNGIASIPMGAGVWGSSSVFSEGIGNVVCALDCGNGDTYTLNYHGTVPLGDASGFGGVKYGLHLEGTVSAVPVPAAVWLFGSGLMGLVGVARRRKA